ncbi:hypothetical protein BV20DRAFT_971558 [Pilatotrama ljubarskyi]|nr:hypothetical protein BV20DRAFT_971558 [Pilatotrama ljubarskyi]
MRAQRHKAPWTRTLTWCCLSRPPSHATSLSTRKPTIHHRATDRFMASATIPTIGNLQAPADGGSLPVDAKESTTIRFEWTLRGLKTLFESSKGEAKSKVTKSPRFGDGRWQILFYANSGIVGTDGQTFVSLYLACEPTMAEKESAVNGKWSREGLYNFNFEIRNLSKTIQFNFKEAHDHSFYFPGAQNWGWAQFARRDAVFYQPSTVRQHDAFLIICSITSSPTPPAPVPAIPRYTVSRDLLDNMGSLLDDPTYSDVEFVLPQRGRGEPRKIYAARKILRRVEYFDDMFNSGFVEGMSAAEDVFHTSGVSGQSQADDASVSDVGAYAQHFDDSDFEDEDDSVMLNNDPESAMDLSEPPVPTPVDEVNAALEEEGASGKRRAVTEETLSEGERERGTEAGDDPQTQRNTRPKLSHPSSPRSREMLLEHPEAHPGTVPPLQGSYHKRPTSAVPGPKKVRIVVRDVAYVTYRAVLYYIYTDMIVFAPLSSSFLATSSDPSTQYGTTVASTPAALPSDSQAIFAFAGLGPRASQQQPSETAASSNPVVVGPRTRREWVVEWERNNPGRPQPPSAKSVYRLADRLGLQDLKDRAFRHIVKSLTVANVAQEAFSAFSAAFEDVRKVEIAFMFDHWMEVRTGALANIGQQLRLGKFPGFEEVWPMIVQNLVAEEKKVVSDTSR